LEVAKLTISETDLSVSFALSVSKLPDTDAPMPPNSNPMLAPEEMLIAEETLSPVIDSEEVEYDTSNETSQFEFEYASGIHCPHLLSNVVVSAHVSSDTPVIPLQQEYLYLKVVPRLSISNPRKTPPDAPQLTTPPVPESEVQSVSEMYSDAVE